MPRRARSFLIAAAILLLDRISKLYIRANFSAIDTLSVIPGFFNIVHTENPGAAFGMLADSPSTIRGAVLVWISVVIMAIIGVMLWKQRPGTHSTLSETGLALVFGGASGNLVDRLVHGTVTDFVQFFFGPYEFPSFNVADSAISIGAALLILDLWLSRAKHTKPVASAPVEPGQTR
jgi:signal peptidase II